MRGNGGGFVDASGDGAGSRSVVQVDTEVGVDHRGPTSTESCSREKVKKGKMDSVPFLSHIIGGTCHPRASIKAGFTQEHIRSRSWVARSSSPGTSLQTIENAWASHKSSDAPGRNFEKSKYTDSSNDNDRTKGCTM